MRSFYVGDLRISPHVASKIMSKHGVTVDEVLEVVHGTVKGRWSVDDNGDRRLLVVGDTLAGRRLKIVLQPVDTRDGVWRLRTALVATRR